MPRLRAVLFGLTVSIATLGLAPSGSAQEAQEEEPQVLRLSFFKCDLSGANDEQLEEVVNRDVAAMNAVIEEGNADMLHGYFYHWWADEWNVGVYTIGPSIQGIVDAVEEAGNRLEEQYGDAPTAFDQACPEHRDGFYTLGPDTGDDDEEEGASGGS